MKLHMVGCSHHSSPVEIRERLAFSQDQAVEALATSFKVNFLTVNRYFSRHVIVLSSMRRGMMRKILRLRMI